MTSKEHPTATITTPNSTPGQSGRFGSERVAAFRRNQWPLSSECAGNRHWPEQHQKALIAMDKKSLSERDICTKFITPALRKAGWDEMAQIREEVSFTKGRIIVRGKLVSPARLSSRRLAYPVYTHTH